MAASLVLQFLQNLISPFRLQVHSTELLTKVAAGLLTEGAKPHVVVGIGIGMSCDGFLTGGLGVVVNRSAHN